MLMCLNTKTGTTDYLVAVYEYPTKAKCTPVGALSVMSDSVSCRAQQQTAVCSLRDIVYVCVTIVAVHREWNTISLRQSSIMSKLDVSVGLDTSGRNGAGSWCREAQSSPVKKGWPLKSLKPFLPRRSSLSEMSPTIKEQAFSEISGPDEGNSKWSWE